MTAYRKRPRRRVSQAPEAGDPTPGAGPQSASRHATVGPRKPPARVDRAAAQDELSITLAEFVARYPVSTLVDPIIRRAAAQRVPAVLTPLRRLPRNYIGWCFALQNEVPRLPVRAVQQLVLALSIFLARHPEPVERGAWFAEGGGASMTPEAFHWLAIEALEPPARRVFEARTGIEPKRTLRQLAREFDTYIERIRFLEQQARHSVRALGIRYDAWRTLDVAFPRWWPRLCAGGVRYVPVTAARRPLPPPMAYLCEAVGGFDACLSRYCQRVHDGWLLKTDTSRSLAQRALALQAELIEGWPLPQPLAPLALRFGVPQREFEILLQHGDRLRCEQGYVRAAGGGSTEIALDTTLRRSDAPVGVAELQDRLPDDRGGRRRDLDRTLRAAPHLFLRIWDHQWCSLTALPGRLRATPGEVLGRLEALGPNDGTVRHGILRLVRDRGPMSWSELTRAAGPAVRGALASAISRLPDVVKCAPGIYGYRGHVERDALQPPKTFFREAQAVAWAFGRRCGVPPAFFPLWTPANEMALCRWARDGARTHVYESLVAQVEPSDWPGLDAAEDAFWRTERERCGFTLSTRRELGFNGVFPASRLLAVLLVGKLRGQVSWVEANRCMGGRINARSGILAIALLATMRVLQPNADWRRPHPVQADRAQAAIAEFVEVLTRTGRLPWALVESSMRVDDAPAAEWIRPEIVARFLGRARRVEGLKPAADGPGGLTP